MCPSGTLTVEDSIPIELKFGMYVPLGYTSGAFFAVDDLFRNKRDMVEKPIIQGFLDGFRAKTGTKHLQYGLKSTPFDRGDLELSN